MFMSTDEVRRAFLSFFESKGHQIVESSSLVPANDPTLLFTNAGMNQFKDCFLGLEKRAYTRATTAQRCVRAGGKHNDLENVGFTARHHTFFEMLGNFSFGDYFKEDAIQYAWEFLTDVLQLPKERLLVTVYETDDEAFDIWNKKVGIPADRIIRIGDKKGGKKFDSDNFWQMGDTGPCGPCTEIFYDHGDHIWGGPPGSPEEDGDRFIEIWNNVFMQFNRHADGTMEPLPKPSVDTGMGIERISAIMQGVHSNYEIDVFQTLIKAAADAIGYQDLTNQSLRVVADHIRSCAFLIVDGVMPSNEGRGYVLRRIIRRAVRHGNKLGAQGAFFHKLVGPLAEVMGTAGVELKKQQALVEKVLRIEEENFGRTLDRGMSILNDALDQLSGQVLDGETVFKLYDTYGFPADLTNDVARERGFSIDEAGFEQAMEEQRQRAREAGQFGTDYNSLIKSATNTEFCGYTASRGQSVVREMFVEGAEVSTLSAGDKAIIVLDNTPFYAESGGQCGDTGVLKTDAGIFHVEDTQKLGNAIAHHGVIAQGVLATGDQVDAIVDEKRRAAISLNHSATHLLHAALRKVLGEHVAQKGSLVRAETLRFDFSHLEAMTAAEIKEVERLVNQEVRRNHSIETNIMNIDEAKAKGAMALFGEKYDDQVRVLSMGDFSTELCGGIHASNTGDIGLFKIISEGGIAAGIRRIEAVTGEGALDYLDAQQAQHDAKVSEMAAKAKLLEKEIQQLKDKLAAKESAGLINQVKQIAGVNVLVAQLNGADNKALRGMVDDLKNQLSSGIIMLGNVAEGKVGLIAGVTNDLTNKVKAGELVNMVALQVGGKGGGRPDMAQAGGTDAHALPSALESVDAWIAERL
ncbi:TPA: alanine--tRNA ligase [Vibrio cholerae]|uniref:Alanine--tRNA ligase n=8 Tax=Gammaproteobacteria TaxID=1236 RepID=SYA_VIBCH|nr:alanine--tRNA ligase [Vibrio cholerae]Q56648.2 RecName: Full=Alanine--tRNA ligase; AltName: Full=Alanyl-tRNA synthetase; Short=AlaRS [Vibrio cholerae O1 biovar El Tor str. N16961]EAZ72934.1 alanyl-tRNA synthetase [Vibrio cholerae NCTC 8457]EYC46951.1 alanyl-tRNA synthetase [Vibrio cholerae O1 biovar El Tor str. L-3226]MDG6206941.1 alanine--tRNA ligase [Vibrio sp. NO3-D2]AAF93713.1 alanyl-tRNA synthetase [Vibrio cholerae O1 biovar El Tor str. N16961]ACP04828.1 alanyl-tRNA synthetase [Vibrio